MKKFLLLALIGAVSISPAFADDDEELEKKCKVTRQEAKDIAVKKVPGTVSDADVERSSDGKYFWSIDVKPATGVEKEINIDGQTGEVLSVANDDD